MSGKGKVWVVIFWSRFFKTLIRCASMPESTGAFWDIIDFFPNASPLPFITSTKPTKFPFSLFWIAVAIPRGYASR
jgi:hypothetical protein